MFETQTFCGQEEFFLTFRIDREKERQKGGGGGKQKKRILEEREIRDLKTKKIAYFHE